MKYLDIEKWKRKDHFHFFNRFEEPFFGVCVELECTKTYQRAKESGSSFFLHYLHKSLLAANEIEAFRYRIDEQNRVIVHEQVNASPTINRPDGTFGFSYIDFVPDFAVFEEKAKKEIERVQHSSGLVPALSSENVIHYSSLPWIKFTSLSHARSFSHKDSIPKITFGKLTQNGDQYVMPVSLHVHHALMDGYDAGRFLERFQALLQE